MWTIILGAFFMKMTARTTAMLFAAATTLSMATQASAYFVRPVAQYGQGEMMDGLTVNGVTQKSVSFHDGFTSVEAHVNLADGTLKTYASSNGPQSSFLISTGIYGDTIRYTGSETEAVSFSVDFDGIINSNQYDLGDDYPYNRRYIGVDAYFAVFEAGTGATINCWTVVCQNLQGVALYNDRYYTSYDVGLSDYQGFNFSLGSDLFLKTNASYEVYVAFNLLLQPGIYGGSIEMDSLNTSRLSIHAPNGSFTSQSGVLLGFDKTPAGVPEPASWAMLIVGFGAVGYASRRRRHMVSA